MSFVLIVDDNPSTADALKEMVTIFGVEARVAYGARAGLMVMNRQKPALILLDLNMPGLNGLEVLRFIRRDVNLADVPVVVVTSEDQKELHRQATLEGANDLVIKPMMLDQLEAVLRRFGLLQ